MRYHIQGCRNLASAVILSAINDYNDPGLRKEVHQFLISPLFRMYADIAGLSPLMVRKTITGKDCMSCVFRDNPRICVDCTGDPGTSSCLYRKKKLVLRLRRKND